MRTFKTFSTAILTTLCGVSFTLLATATSVGTLHDARYQLCFTPHKATEEHNCNTLLIQNISAAKDSILVQAYSFTSKPIAQALVRALKRGVSVVVVVDKSQLTARYSKVQMLLNAAIPVYVDYRPAIAHNKVMVIDDKTVETGSYNFTNSAEYRNAENMLIIKDKKLAKTYTANIISRIKRAKRVIDYCQTKKCKVHARPTLMPGIQKTPPAYLSVPHFKDCLVTAKTKTYVLWCMPTTQPKACPQKSWMALEKLNLLSCQSIHQRAPSL